MPARLAPTPSGYLHRGNAVNFALNALLARETDGRLLLRIDDLDRARFREAYLEDIFRTIAWLGIEVTDGPRNPEEFHASWSQEYRLPEYAAALEKLRSHPLVFACPCSRRELAGGAHMHGCLKGEVTLDRTGVAWRLNVRSMDPISIPDRTGRSFRVNLHEAMPDFTLRKKDERPSYQLACTVDDLRFGITDVGRGRDLLASTAAQAVLSDLLGYPSLWDRIRFVHHPLVADETGAKLSKSAGAAGISALRERVTPESLFSLAADWLGN